MRGHTETIQRVNRTEMSRVWQWLILVSVAGIYYGFLIWSEFSIFPERTLFERLEVITGTRVPLMLYFVATPILTIGAWVFTIVFWQQLFTLTVLAKILPLQVSQLIRYQRVSDPFLRLVVAFSFFTALLPFSLLLAKDPPMEAVVATIAVSIAFVLLCAVYFFPVAILRNRIHVLLHEAQLALAEEMADENFTAVDRERLMMRQMYLESRWEWPLASNVQKLIVFVLLPPAAWVMAALVENLLF